MFRGVLKSVVLSNKNISQIITIPKRLKAELPIKWERPVKDPSYHPKNTGDLKTLMDEDVNLSRFPTLYEKSEELQTADETVKKIFSLEFQKRKVINQVIKKDYIDSVKRHELDRQSPEAKIAGMTATIRILQVVRLTQKKKHLPRSLRVLMKELVDARKKKLRLLRAVDYRLFEWLLDQLELEYKPKPFIPERVERKRSLTRLTDKYCEDLRAKRLDEYKVHLESQQAAFLEGKIEKLKWIQENEKRYDVPPTVTDDDIAAVTKQLEEVKLKRESNVQADL